MQPPLQLHQPRPAVPPAVDLRAFLNLAFRPLYLAGTAWAALSVAVWIFAPQWLQPPLAGVAWHAHEMLWGFVATIAVGFLLTAGATWTGFNPLQGWPLAIAGVLWLLARLGFLLGGTAAFVVAAAAELAMFLLAAASMARVVIRSRNRRNYGVPVLMLALAAADAAFLAAVHAGDARLMQSFQGGLLVMAVIALLIARRVIPSACPGCRRRGWRQPGRWGWRRCWRGGRWRCGASRCCGSCTPVMRVSPSVCWPPRRRRPASNCAVPCTYT